MNLNTKIQIAKKNYHLWIPKEELAVIYCLKFFYNFFVLSLHYSVVFNFFWLIENSNLCIVAWRICCSWIKNGNWWIVTARCLPNSMDFQFDSRVSLDYRNMYLPMYTSQQVVQARYLVAKVGKSTVVVLHNTSLGDFCPILMMKNWTEIQKNWHCITSITWPCAWIRARYKVLQLKANYHLPACLLYRIWFLTFKQKRNFHSGHFSPENAHSGNFTLVFCWNDTLILILNSKTIFVIQLTVKFWIKFLAMRLKYGFRSLHHKKRLLMAKPYMQCNGFEILLKLHWNNFTLWFREMFYKFS